MSDSKDLKLDYFCELLDFAMPWDEGMAVLLVAYVDASERDSEMFSVAALAFGADRAKKATKKWIDLWGKTRCHMTDLHAGRKRVGNPFYGWSDEQAGDRLIASVKIITDHVSYAAAVSGRVSDLARIAPTSAVPDTEMYLDVFKAAYPLCCSMVMASLGSLLEKANSDPDIAYFFEKGDLHQGASQRFLNKSTSPECVDSVGIKTLYGHRSHTVMSKEDSRLFEMADIFAWEWAKHMERLMQGKPMRGSLKALLGDGVQGETDFKSSTRRTFHMAGPMFGKYMHDIKAELFSQA